ncbi:MAG: metallophosphoesterase [Flavobacteriales bacterium]|nr:metallophosphoesterase [Flavobacteriales bacterium]
MTSRALFGFALFLGFLVIIDLYAWKGISTALGNSSVLTRRWVRWVYWAESIGMFALLVWVSISIQELRANRNYSFVFSLAALFMLFLLPKLVVVIFHGMEDVLQGLRWLWCRMAPGGGAEESDKISRLRFVSQVGLALAAIPFGAVLYGISQGSTELPCSARDRHLIKTAEEFQRASDRAIGDMHLGSFPVSSDIVQRGIDLIDERDPDLILFTGDLVNDYSEEAEPWLDALKGLNARLGKYSILGNHDYSDYASWPDAGAKRANLERLKGHHRTLGFRLMLDEHLSFERTGNNSP